MYDNNENIDNWDVEDWAADPLQEMIDSYELRESCISSGFGLALPYTEINDSAKLVALLRSELGDPYR